MKIRIPMTALLASALSIAVSAHAQQGLPPQPAAGQQPQGTADATAGKTTSNAGAPTITAPQPATTTQAPLTDATTQPAIANPNVNSNASAKEDEGLTAAPASDTEQPVSNGGFPITSAKPLHEGALPKTKEVEDPTDVSDILPIPPLPKGTATLIGGRVVSVDPVRDHIKVRPYGGKKMDVYFDERSHVYRNGKAVMPTAIHKGDRIYLDTQLDRKSDKVFARNVRVQTKPLQADARGELLSFDRQNGIAVVKDDLTGQGVRFRVQPSASVDDQGHPGALADLQQGSIVQARFLPGQDGADIVNAITILAAPGNAYAFEGKITNLNLRNNTLGIENSTDGKIYDVRYNPSSTPIGDIRVGSEVTVEARYTGNGYEAQSLTPSENMTVEEQDQASKKPTEKDDSAGSGKKSKKQKKDKTEKEGLEELDNSDTPR